MIGDATPGHRRLRAGARAPSRRRRCTRCSRPRCAPSPGAPSKSTSERSARCGRASPRVAAGNPHAWSRTAYSPRRDLHEPAPDNRMVVFPYTKRMCANIDVDQGAALLLCSYEAARAAGIADDRLVFLHAGADAHDHWFVTERAALAERPRSARPCARRSTPPESASTTSRASTSTRASLPRCRSRCTRSASAVGARGDDRPLTVTGGLGFAGGPGEQLPDARRSRRWSTCCAPIPVRSASPPRSVGTSRSTRSVCGRAARRTRPFRASTVQAAGRSRALAGDAAGLVDGSIDVEATPVVMERDGHAVVRDRRRPSPRRPARARERPRRRRARATMTEAWEGRTSRGRQRRVDERDRRLMANAHLATRRRATHAQREAHPALPALRLRQAVPALGRDGARLPALRSALRARAGLLGRRARHQHRSVIGGLFAIVWSSGRADPHRPRRPVPVMLADLRPAHVSGRSSATRSRRRSGSRSTARLATLDAT